MTRLCFVDVEPTGPDPTTHEAWEIAIIARDDDSADREYAWQVRPDLHGADPATLRASRFYERIQTGQPGTGSILAHHDRNAVGDPYQAHLIADSIAGLLADAVLVAVEPGTKATLLQKFLRSQFECGTWHRQLVDILSVAAGRLMGRGQNVPPPWRSTTITDMLGLSAEKDRHSALGDARIVRDIWDRCTSGDTAG